MKTTRREFLKGAAAGVVCIAALPALPALRPKRVATLVVRRDYHTQRGVWGPTTSYLFHFFDEEGAQKFYAVQFRDEVFPPAKAKAFAIDQFREVLDRKGTARIWPAGTRCEWSTGYDEVVI